VKQGGLLSAELYKLYIEDLLKSYEISKIGCRIGTITINAVACADDIALVSDNPHTSLIMMAAFNGEMFVVKPRWSGDCFSVNIVRKLVLAMCSSSLHIIGYISNDLVVFSLAINALMALILALSFKGIRWVLMPIGISITAF
jgi:hypothetical protein